MIVDVEIGVEVDVTDGCGDGVTVGTPVTLSVPVDTADWQATSQTSMKLKRTAALSDVVRICVSLQ